MKNALHKRHCGLIILFPFFLCLFYFRNGERWSGNRWRINLTKEDIDERSFSPVDNTRIEQYWWITLTREASGDSPIVNRSKWKPVRDGSTGRSLGRRPWNAYGGLAICPKTGSTSCVIGRPGSRAFPRNVCEAHNVSRLTGRHSRPLSPSAARLAQF